MVPDSRGEAASEGEIVRITDDLHDEARAFQRRAYPRRRREWTGPRWDWMFLASAKRVGQPPAVWVYRDAHGVRGQRAAILVRLRCGEQEMDAGWMVDTVVLPDLRGRGVGDRLIGRATRDLPVGLSLGQTGQIRALQDRYGWRQVASMHCWSLVIGPTEAFEGRLRVAPMRAAVAWAGWGWQALCRATAARPRGWEVRVVDRFGAAHDALWLAVRHQHTCAVVRDASYLNWKYVDQPFVDVRRLEIVDAHGQVRGVCVWTRHGADVTHRYVRGWILDMVVLASEGAAVRSLLAAVADDAAAHGVAVLEFDALAPALVPHLRRGGWVRGGATRHLRVAAHDVPPDVQTRLGDPRGWYLTRGDSDGDHPWWTPDGREPEAPPA